MASILNVPAANQLLFKLPEVERQAFMAKCETVKLTFGEVLLQPVEFFTHVYFPIDSFISLISVIDTDNRLEVAMAGREGMLGMPLILNVKETQLIALVQGAGSALRMTAERFQRLLLVSPILHQRLKRYIYVAMSQLATSAACNHFHRIEERLARWLLMTQDRAGTDQLNLTHEFLAMMLGVRRAGITLAAIAMQARGLICYQRGTIMVLDRLGLIEASCECYSKDCALYAKMLPVL